MAPLVTTLLHTHLVDMSLTRDSRGCVTPKVISNMKDESNMDPELIDGYEDLDEENQAKVMRALEQGHVDDADWRGVGLV